MEKTKLDEKNPFSDSDQLKQRAKEMMSANSRKSSVHKKTKPQAPQALTAQKLPNESQLKSPTSKANGNGVVAETNDETQKKRQSTVTRQPSMNQELGAEYINTELAKLRETQSELDQKGMAHPFAFLSFENVII